MKQILLTLVFIASLTMAFAQQGLFGLSYDMDFSEAESLLIDKDFSNADDAYGITYFEPDEEEYVKWIELRIDENEKLRGWTVCYTPEWYEDCEEVAIDALISWHGEDYELEYDDWDYEYYIWDLGGGRYVEAVWDDVEGYFFADYY